MSLLIIDWIIEKYIALKEKYSNEQLITGFLIIIYAILAIIIYFSDTIRPLMKKHWAVSAIVILILAGTLIYYSAFSNSKNS